MKQEKADWDTAKRVLGDSGFMRSLLEFDKDHIPDGVMKKLRKYTDSPDFTPEAVAKQSKAAQSLCMWCRAMEVYDRIAKVPAMTPARPWVHNSNRESFIAKDGSLLCNKTAFLAQHHQMLHWSMLSCWTTCLSRAC